MTRDLDLLKADVDVIGMIIRLREVSASGAHAEDTADKDTADSDPERDGG